MKGSKLVPNPEELPIYPFVVRRTDVSRLDISPALYEYLVNSNLMVGPEKGTVPPERQWKIVPISPPTLGSLSISSMVNGEWAILDHQGKMVSKVIIRGIRTTPTNGKTMVSEITISFLEP